MSPSGDGEDQSGSSEADDTDGTAAGDADAADTGETGDGRDWRENPEPDLPSLGPEIPSVDVPEVEVPGTDPDSATVGADVDVDTAKGFWRLVLIFDVALLALALGPMFVYFMDDWRRGGMLVGFGALVFLYGVARYREFQAAGEDADDETDPVEEA